VADGVVTGEINTTPTSPVPQAVHADLDRLCDAMAPGTPEEVLGRALLVWTALLGAISYELFGHLHGVIDSYDVFFERQMQSAAAYLASGRPPVLIDGGTLRPCACQALTTTTTSARGHRRVSHGATRSIYGTDRDGNEPEVMRMPPRSDGASRSDRCSLAAARDSETTHSSGQRSRPTALTDASGHAWTMLNYTDLGSPATLVDVPPPVLPRDVRQGLCRRHLVVVQGTRRRAGTDRADRAAWRPGARGS